MLSAPAAAPLKQAPGRAPRCTVGLLTWNAGQDAVDCLETVLAQTEPALDLVWIDNASTDGTPERARRAFPQLPAPFINPKNLGFCVGHNQGVAACRTTYYLALNQDVKLEPDYIEKLCDWMDERPELAMTSGLILLPREAEEDADRVYSAGLVFPRARFAFELGIGMGVRERWRGRRIVPGVNGSTMMLRVAACRAASLPEGDVFPSEFFAYCEEVDLALRLARAGYRCGLEGAALARHRSHGSGGIKRPQIRARLFCNHWLLTLRHESWGAIARELPWIAKGLVQYWLPRYLRYPRATALALGYFVREAPRARRFYQGFEKKFGPTQARLAEYKALALSELRACRGQD